MLNGSIEIEQEVTLGENRAGVERAFGAVFRVLSSHWPAVVVEAFLAIERPPPRLVALLAYLAVDITDPVMHRLFEVVPLRLRAATETPMRHAYARLITGAMKVSPGKRDLISFLDVLRCSCEGEWGELGFIRGG